MTDLYRAVVIPLGQRAEVNLSYVPAELYCAKAHQAGYGEQRTVRSRRQRGELRTFGIGSDIACCTCRPGGRESLFSIHTQAKQMLRWRLEGRPFLKL